MNEMNTNTNPDTTQTTTEQTDDYDSEPEHEPRFQLPALPAVEFDRRNNGRIRMKFGMRRLLLTLFIAGLGFWVIGEYADIGFLHPANENLLLVALGLWTVYKLMKALSGIYGGAYMTTYPPIETVWRTYADWGTDLLAEKIAEHRGDDTDAEDTEGAL